jgi:hypothetical protein
VIRSAAGRGLEVDVVDGQPLLGQRLGDGVRRDRALAHDGGEALAPEVGDRRRGRVGLGPDPQPGLRLRRGEVVAGHPADVEAAGDGVEEPGVGRRPHGVDLAPAQQREGVGGGELLEVDVEVLGLELAVLDAVADGADELARQRAGGDGERGHLVERVGGRGAGLAAGRLALGVVVGRVGPGAVAALDGGLGLDGRALAALAVAAPGGLVGGAAGGGEGQEEGGEGAGEPAADSSDDMWSSRGTWGDGEGGGGVALSGRRWWGRGPAAPRG